MCQIVVLPCVCVPIWFLVVVDTNCNVGGFFVASLWWWLESQWCRWVLQTMESLRDGHNDTICVCLMIFSLEPSKDKAYWTHWRKFVFWSYAYRIPTWWFICWSSYSTWKYLVDKILGDDGESFVNVGKLYFSLPKQTSHGIVHFENIKLHHNNYISYPQPCDRHSIQQTLKNLQLPLNIQECN